MVERKYTAQQDKFLEELYLNDGDTKAAAKAAGYANTRNAISSLKSEIIEISKELIASSSVKAATSLHGILANPASLGARNAIAAANSILDRAGVKEEVKEHTNPVKVTFYLPEKMKLEESE